MRRSALSTVVALLAACSSGNTGTNTPPPPPPPPPPAPVASVTVTLSSSSIAVGGSTQATAVLRDASGTSLTGRTIAWTSSAPAVATVSATGQVSALSAGNATITATAEGAAGAATVTVTPPPVATVMVALGSPTLAAGGTTAAIATTLDASGAVLTGRTVTWSSSNAAVASVAANGQVSALAPGTASIIATSEGRTGSAQLTVTQPPVVSVQVFGTQRVKVGDPYQLTVEARLADGTLVQRPITYSIATQGSMTISGSGVLTALQTGTLAFTVTVEGVTTNASVTAYDWFLSTSGLRTAVDIPSDIQISNQFGTTEYPSLVISCFQGTVLIYIDTDHFVTASGIVSYAFDGGTIFSGSWIEFDNFSALGHPGPTNLATKNFASLIALSTTFDFAFSEFQSVARATRFRVSGLTPYLNQIFAACPSNALRAEDAGSSLADVLRLAASRGGGTPMDDQRALRAATGAGEASPPELHLGQLRSEGQQLLSTP
ncbi:MAG: Ig-like domain-containing protein [Gemmatimonadales bacterium]